MLRRLRDIGVAAAVMAALPVTAQLAMAQTADQTVEGGGSNKAAVLDTYADIAHAGYEDALIAARNMKAAIDALIENPNEQTMRGARAAWLTARIPYQQTEAYRFGNPIVDDWEGRVNAWPLDEGLIDYVDDTYGTQSDVNAFYNVNVIANPQIQVAGRTIDASTLTPELLAEELQEAEGVEANVATGYHAVEFLLWGQDLNGTEAGAGERPASDFDVENCTGGNCDRRVEYLQVVTDLLLQDLEEMVGNWEEDGAARQALTANGEDGGIVMMLTGLGSLSYGEMAGERMKLGLMLHDPEEEHDCFSDNTHNSHFYDIVGIRNVYLGQYRRIDGSMVEGPSLSDLVEAQDPALDEELRADLDRTLQVGRDMVLRAETVEAYDQMIGPNNEAGNATVQKVIDALVDQTRSIERAVATLGLGNVSIEGSDSLDNPTAIFQ